MVSVALKYRGQHQRHYSDEMEQIHAEIYNFEVYVRNHCYLVRSVCFEPSEIKEKLLSVKHR